MMYPFLLALLHLLSSAEGCSCVGKSVQSIFCESDFVALVTVVNETYVADKLASEAPVDEDYPDGVPQFSFSLYIADDDMEGTYFYDVNVEQVYVAGLKARSALNNKSARLKSDADPGLCGLRLDVGKKELVTAMIDRKDGIPVLSSCNSIHEDYDKLTAFQLRALEHLYKKSCNCKPAMNIMCDEGHLCTKSDECALLQSDGDKSCYDQYSVCMKKSKHGRCEWLQSKEFEDCLLKKGR